MLSLRIDSFHSLFPDLHACRNRLSAASETSTGTCHDFNKMVWRFSFPHLFHYFIGICKSVGYSHFQLSSLKKFPVFGTPFNLYCCLFYSCTRPGRRKKGSHKESR